MIAARLAAAASAPMGVSRIVHRRDSHERDALVSL
jgi:hypothetical protein